VTIAQLLNQNSFLLTAVAVLGGWLAVLIVRRRRGLVWLAWIAATSIATAVFLTMRTAAPQTFETADDVQRALSVGRPTLVEFYSDF